MLRLGKIFSFVLIASLVQLVPLTLCFGAPVATKNKTTKASTVKSPSPKSQATPTKSDIKTPLPAPDLVDVTDPTKEGAQDQPGVAIIREQIKNNSTHDYSKVGVFITLKQLDGDDQLKALAVTDALKAGETWTAEIPVSFFGQPYHELYDVTTIAGELDGKLQVFDVSKNIFSSGNFCPIRRTQEIERALIHYKGPSFDSAFKNNDLKLEWATLKLASEEEGALPSITGEVLNASAKTTYKDVEIRANLYDFDTQIDSSLANTQDLAPGDTWRFKITFLGDNHYWSGFKITSVDGTK